MDTRKIASILFCLLALSESLNAAAAPTLTERYIEVFSENSSEQAQREALNQLQWSGLSDPRLYDLKEQRLIDLYPTAKGDDVDLASWYAKSLGTSGLEKYRATLQGIINSSPNGKIRKYAGEGLENIDKYARWNPIISNPEGRDSSKSELVNGFANMLRSEDWVLKNMAAKRIYADATHDPYLLNLLQQAILKEYQSSTADDYQITTLAWMTRALASSGIHGYRATIEDVANNAESKKQRNYGEKYLKSMP